MGKTRYELNKELAQMLKGGVIMDVTTPEQARIAEDAGACAVMALERIPADIRAAGGVSRMSDPAMIRGIQEAVSIPVMAKCRIGHFVEAQILEAIEIDYIDESEVLTPADSNIFKRYGAVVDFFNGVTLEDGGTEEQQMERMNALADDIGGQFDYLLNGNVAAGIFEKCGPLTVTKNGDFFFEQVLEGIGALIEKTTKQRLEKKLAKARRAAGNAPSVRARK